MRALTGSLHTALGNLKISRFPFINKKDNDISFGGRLKIPVTALAEGQNTWVKCKQRCSVQEWGSAVRLHAHPGGHCTIKV